MTEVEAKIMEAMVNVALELPADADREHLRGLVDLISEALIDETMEVPRIAGPPSEDLVCSQDILDRRRWDWVEKNQVDLIRYSGGWTVRNSDTCEHYAEKTPTAREAIDRAMEVKRYD